MAEASYVYVISGDHGRQKIGSSDNPARRIKDLQTGSPYKLRFEFIGEAEQRGAGAIEVEAHFMLNQHKAPGGDEWFTVPPDVALTAVMAAAHRLGYRCKPVDIDGIKARAFEIGKPAWEKWVTVPWVIGFLYVQVVYMWPRLESGKPGTTGAFIIESIVMLLLLKLAVWLTVKVGREFVNTGIVLNNGLASARSIFDRDKPPPSSKYEHLAPRRD